MCQALFSQKIEADFRIVTDLVEQTNLQSIKNLEKSVNDFLNFNNWIEETVGFDYSISISILLRILIMVITTQIYKYSQVGLSIIHLIYLH